MTGAQRREAVFAPGYLENLLDWIRTDRKPTLRTLNLVEPAVRDPFEGVGRPEVLRGDLAGRWSRRIDREHRLLCQVGVGRVYFLAARYHY